MPIDRFKTKGDQDDDIIFVLRDPDELYDHSDVCDLLEKAEALGFSLERGTELEKLTVRELDILVNRIQ
jgi:hypothetical protein